MKLKVYAPWVERKRCEGGREGVVLCRRSDNARKTSPGGLGLRDVTLQNCKRVKRETKEKGGKVTAKKKKRIGKQWLIPQKASKLKWDSAIQK